MTPYYYPPDDLLRAAVEEKGCQWLADELGVSRSALHSHLKRRGLPTTRRPKELEVSDELRAVARLVGK